MIHGGGEGRGGETRARGESLRCVFEFVWEEEGGGRCMYGLEIYISKCRFLFEHALTFVS